MEIQWYLKSGHNMKRKQTSIKTYFMVTNIDKITAIKKQKPLAYQIMGQSNLRKSHE